MAITPSKAKGSSGRHQTLVVDTAQMADLLADLKRDNTGPKGFTAQELADESGVALRTAQRRVVSMVADGKIEFVGKRATYSLTGNGASVKVPEYRYTNDD